MQWYYLEPLGAYGVRNEAVDTRDHMLSTTFSRRLLFVINDCFDTQRTVTHFVLSMRKVKTNRALFVVDNSFSVTSHRQLWWHMAKFRVDDRKSSTRKSRRLHFASSVNSLNVNARKVILNILCWDNYKSWFESTILYFDAFTQGGHKPGKHGKPGKL